MSLSQQTRIRLPTIKQGLIEGLNYTQIGEQCGRTEKTIDRDVQSWVDSGEFETWLKTEFVRLHGLKCKGGDLDKAYDNITKLVGRMITRKSEIKSIEEIREIKLMWVKDETNQTNQ